MGFIQDKGLGEMNSVNSETTMDEGSIFETVMKGDAHEANKVFDILMGMDVPSENFWLNDTRGYD